MTKLSIENPNYYLPVDVPLDNIILNCSTDGNADNNCILSGKCICNGFRYINDIITNKF